MIIAAHNTKHDNHAGARHGRGQQRGGGGRGARGAGRGGPQGHGGTEEVGGQQCASPTRPAGTAPAHAGT